MTLLVCILGLLPGVAMIVFAFWLEFMPINTRCKFSRRYFDLHDYEFHKGGSGYPMHFHMYTCWNCDRKFSI